MSSSTFILKRNEQPVNKKFEEALAMEYFFTELNNTTANCLICRQQVLFKEYNMKRHYFAKHAGEYDKYKGRRRKTISDQLHAAFNRSKGTVADPNAKRESEPQKSSPGIYEFYFYTFILKAMNR